MPQTGLMNSAAHAYVRLGAEVLCLRRQRDPTETASRSVCGATAPTNKQPATNFSPAAKQARAAQQRADSRAAGHVRADFEKEGTSLLLAAAWLCNVLVL